MASSGSGPGLAGLGGGNGQPTGGSGALAPPQSPSVSSSNGLRLGAVGGKSTSTASPSATGDNDGVVMVAVADTAHAAESTTDTTAPSSTSSKPTNATAVGVGEHRLTTTTFGERLQRAISPITDYNASKVACSRQARSAKKATLLLVCAFVIFSLTFWQMHAVRAWWTRPCPCSVRYPRAQRTLTTTREEHLEMERKWRAQRRVAVVTYVTRNGQHEAIANVTRATWEEWCRRHGYTYVDASADVVDSEQMRGRQPEWGSVLAVRKHLPDHDWVFWLDADIVLTNPRVSLDYTLLPPAHADVTRRGNDAMAYEQPHFIAAADRRHGLELAAWLIANTEWSDGLLESWIEAGRVSSPPPTPSSASTPLGGPPPTSSSSVNQALRETLARLTRRERSSRVKEAPRCALGSQPMRYTPGRLWRLARSPSHEWMATWRRGDLMMHVKDSSNPVELAKSLALEHSVQNPPPSSILPSSSSSSLHEAHAEEQHHDEDEGGLPRYHFAPPSPMKL